MDHVIPDYRLLRSKKESALALGISERKLEDLIASGEIAVRRVGRRVLLHTVEIERFARRYEEARA